MVATGISLNERFTQMQSMQQHQQGRGRSRSRSRSRRIVDNAMNPSVSAANSRLLQEFKRRHTVQTALKLKRRSLRTTSGRGARVGGVKSVRLAPNGKPMRSNNVTRVATMRADLVANSRRSGSSTNRLPTVSAGKLRQRLGQRRPSVGGAAERVERRQRQQQQQQQQQQLQQRGRSRSRSRSRSRVPQVQRLERVRSQSRSRSNGPQRSQSRSRSRGRDRSTQGRLPVKQRLSVKHRLGVRSGQVKQGSLAKNQRQLRASSQLRRLAGGRVEKRRNSYNSQKNGVSASLAGKKGRPRGRSTTRATVAAGAKAANGPASARRSRSRNRATVATAAAATTAPGRDNSRHRRQGRSAGAGKGKNNRNGNNNNNVKGKAANSGKQGPGQQQLARQGRSRSRTGRKPAGKSPQRTEVKREDLDKELDQYMSTTKSEMDYLLK
ncbi:hypothetical protein KR009_003877 [Drosophila setifemur]|nr:hypothetical protein KR009_003877 [Drosophila setifemur]